MAHFTLIARINAGDGKFPYVNVQFSKNHRPIPIEGATYYLRPANRGRRTPIRIGCQCGDRSPTEHGKLQSIKHCCLVACGSLGCRARRCTTQDPSRSCRGVH